MTATDAARPQPTLAGRLDGTDLSLYAVTVFVWGTSWIALRMQLGVVAPEVSLVWRFALAAALMFAWVAAKGERLRFSAADHLRFAGLGVLIFSTNFVLFYYGGLTIPSGLLAVVFSLASVVNLALGALFLGQRIDGRIAAGGALGVLGVAAMFAPQILGAGFDRASLVGLGLCLGGTLSFCLGNMLSAANQRRGVPVLPANAWGMAYGVLFLTLVGLLRGHAFVVEPTLGYLGSLVWLAVTASVVAFACYLTLLGRIGAARAGYATVLFPVVALAISTVVEGYRWTPLAVAGLVLVIAGNILVLARPRASSPK
ncbi:DMT family transporter [Chelatococcus sp. SYSU_G07232]|uniref:DMT family transporter n=1 Tax=Chelatococcus albus TaxID=3047466 RepID=A0ABT7ALS3_9HYPH|nr:DMT family transporter [Chelatococcus sp. SYSU_G07232]MDJ1160015.1 DMT family transporter [Chelatococcus sp. SYSU_G07232]